MKELAWAYGIATEPAAKVPDDGRKHSLPGTDLAFTRQEISGTNAFGKGLNAPPADWYPEDHPPMPEIVANGDNGRGIMACDLCHYPNGKGKPENANPGGMDKAYLIQQLRDFKSGVRQSAEPRKTNYVNMIDFAKAMTEEEIVQSAEYFSSMPWTPWIEVRETRIVPKTRLQGGMHITLEGDEAGKEPIGKRIIETPKHSFRTEYLRDPRSGFIAWVPVGAIKKGEDLVRNGGGGKTLQCAICHGPDLNGIGTVPSIASRSPSYMARQLNDIKQGTRHGVMTALMKPVVANLTSEDILNIVAYTASLPVPAAGNKLPAKQP